MSSVSDDSYTSGEPLPSVYSIVMLPLIGDPFRSTHIDRRTVRTINPSSPAYSRFQ